MGHAAQQPMHLCMECRRKQGAPTACRGKVQPSPYDSCSRNKVLDGASGLATLTLRVMPRPPLTGGVLPSKPKKRSLLMQASKLLPIGALALAFAIGPAEAAPAPTSPP